MADDSGSDGDLLSLHVASWCFQTQHFDTQNFTYCSTLRLKTQTLKPLIQYTLLTRSYFIFWVELEHILSLKFIHHKVYSG